MIKCPNCGDKINKESTIIKTKDGIRVCSNWCKDDWDTFFEIK